MDNENNWPLVDKNDDGIRPAGRQDACFYCGQRVGLPPPTESGDTLPEGDKNEGAS